MVSGGLVRGLVELSNYVLEGVAHVRVGHPARVHVDRCEGLDDLAQQLGLLGGEGLLLEVEVLEDVDLRGEPVDVVVEVVRQSVGAQKAPRLQPDLQA